MDTRLAEFIPEPQNQLPLAANPTDATEQPVAARSTKGGTNPKDVFCAKAMLDCIDPAALEDTDWLKVMTACKNIGVPDDVVDAFNRRDPQRYDARENQLRINSLHKDYGIGFLCNIAKGYGYDAKETYRLWLNGMFFDTELRAEIDDAQKWLSTLSPADLTAEIARDKKTLRRVALVKCHCPDADVNFFDVLKEAKTLAKDRLSLEVPNSTDNPAQVLSETDRKSLESLVNLNIGDLRDAVSRIADSLADERKEKIKARKRQDVLELKAKEKAEKDAQQQEALQRLKELRKAYRELEDNPDPAVKDRMMPIAEEMISLIRKACEFKQDRYTGEIVLYRNSAYNLNLIFDYDPFLDRLFGFNEFSGDIELLKDATWGSRKGAQWTDNDDSQLRGYLANAYKDLRGREVILDSVVVFAHARKFHPIKKYLLSLPKWDGKKRAETLFIDWLRVDDTPFSREATMKWLAAAVCRVLYPGCSFQYAIVLQGAQGIGKSFILEQLGRQWYCALTDRVDDPHIIDALRLCWLAEFKEMTAMRKADVNSIKAFIELPADTRRRAYARRATTVLRQCVFAITANDDEFLNDPTGSRRFLILPSRSPKFCYVQSVRGEVFDDKLVAQIWAEVFAYCKELFKDGFDAGKLRLSKAAERFGEEIAEGFTRNDLQGEIAAFLDTKILPPVIWNLMSREERRKFFATKCFTITEDDLEARFKTQRVTFEQQVKFKAATQSGDFVVQKTGRDFDTHEERLYLSFYGTVYRQHICAAEVYTEAFGSDRRKNMATVNGVLQHLDGWTQVNRIQKVPAYGDMKKVFWRTPDNIPEPAEPPAQDDTPTATQDDPFCGEPVPPDEYPF